jgi:hypothetical protein
MDELSLIFSSPPAVEVFYIGSIIFMLAYVAGFLLVQAWGRAPGRRAAVRHGIPAVAAALIAVMSGAAVHWATIKAALAASPNMARSISPEELHRAADVARLPVLEVRDPF